MAKKQQEELLEVVAEETVNAEAAVEEAIEKVAVADESKKGMLFSRNDYATKYTYKGENCMITPKGKIKVDDVDLIGKPLAKGLLLRKIN